MRAIVTALLSMMAAVLAFTVAVLVRLVADDFKVWRPLIVRALIRLAARLLPVEHRRYLPIWTSKIGGVPGDLGKVACASFFVVVAAKVGIVDGLVRISVRINCTFLRLLQTALGRKRSAIATATFAKDRVAAGLSTTSSQIGSTLVWLTPSFLTVPGTTLAIVALGLATSGLLLRTSAPFDGRRVPIPIVAQVEEGRSCRELLDAIRAVQQRWKLQVTPVCLSAAHDKAVRVADGRAVALLSNDFASGIAKVGRGYLLVLGRRDSVAESLAHELGHLVAGHAEYSGAELPVIGRTMINAILDVDVDLDSQFGPVWPVWLAIVSAAYVTTCWVFRSRRRVFLNPIRLFP